MSSLQAPLDIPIPDPPSPEDEVWTQKPDSLQLTATFSGVKLNYITFITFHRIWRRTRMMMMRRRKRVKLNFDKNLLIRKY